MEINEILKTFIDCDCEECKALTSGNINKTYLITIKGKQYVLQKINTSVFPNANDLMENICNVTNHLKQKIGKNHTLVFLPCKNGKYYSVVNGECWRMSEFVENSFSVDSTTDLEIIYQTGLAFGEFQKHLSDFDVNKLHTIIPNFHNTQTRFDNLKKAISKDSFSRYTEVKNLADEYLSLEELVTKMCKMFSCGELKLRVTHNDTKCSNVLFDKNTKKHLAVIDLDTIMPGLIGFDFGDAIRSIGASLSEEETDMSKIYLDLNKFTAFAKGFIHTTKEDLTQKEKETLSLGAITMTVENGARFLTDYLNGDIYFKTNYPKNNMYRAQNQLTLAKSMIENYDQMNQIINTIFEEE